MLKFLRVGPPYCWMWTGEYRRLFIFFSNAYERVTKIDQMLHCKASIEKNSKL